MVSGEGIWGDGENGGEWQVSLGQEEGGTDGAQVLQFHSLCV